MVYYADTVFNKKKTKMCNKYTYFLVSTVRINSDFPIFLKDHVQNPRLVELTRVLITIVIIVLLCAIHAQTCSIYTRECTRNSLYDFSTPIRVGVAHTCLEWLCTTPDLNFIL